MKVSILGGGNEIGASCLHIELADTTILIDAGMRMHGDNALPAFGMLSELSDPDVILVTHAHADHIGALPIVHSLFPNVPIYTTPPTIDLMKIMMKDSFKILEERTRLTQTLMPYTDDQINSLLESLLVFPANGVLKIGSVKITAFRAGHILGAVMFLIEGEGESLFVTGDLSFRSGRTIPGAQVPQDIEPDVVIMESTYGNRMHTDRNTEEKRLAENVAEIISNGGFALIPAFALGRAQEVLLILQDYMEKGLIPAFPIYVDGLVTPISRIYKSYPHYLKGPVSHRIKVNGDAFLTEGRCIAVTPKEREKILASKPGCIVASSGMLTGGASAWYAEKLLSDEKNAIFITGYQDEESPGRRLLSLADGTEKTLELNGRVYPVSCQIGKYGLSAHADAEEMNRFIESLKPTYTLLVHGDDDARNELGNKIDPRFNPILTENGESYPFKKRKSGKGIVGKRYRTSREHTQLRDKIGSLILYRETDEQPLKLVICTGVRPKANTLMCQTLKGKTVHLAPNQIHETVGKWNKSMEELEEAVQRVFTFSRPYIENINWSLIPDRIVSLQEIYKALQITTAEEQLAIALALQAIPNEHRHLDPERTVGYKLTDELKKALTILDLPIQALKTNPTFAMDSVREQLKDHPRFIRCGVEHPGTDRESLTISFDFPDGVTKDEREKIAENVLQQTGWKVTYSDSVRQDAIQPLLASLLGRAMEGPSIHLNEKLVVMKEAKPNQAEAAISQFTRITGFQLQFSDQLSQAGSAPKTDSIYKSKADGKVMENNQAIEETKKWANDRGIKIYKTSFRQYNEQTIMEIHFISPEVAKRHEIDLEELSYRTGLSVTFAKQPKQNEIIQTTKEVIPSEWGMTKNPSLHMDKAMVSIKLSSTPNDTEAKKVDSLIENLTGYSLQIK
ncbi:MBL fold metallo-hydrolase [Pseudalkalibacillus decolorationis]|uniref:MBL fold metallo-hydrolase n=1 Tax=Pseudalkalibacillus decolorationis TaxID=163879 RepID=UPI0021486DA8|nr:MBL fold metallo-hydrolase [Pseudalkalibacillus decolorationis]